MGPSDILNAPVDTPVIRIVGTLGLTSAGLVWVAWKYCENYDGTPIQIWNEDFWILGLDAEASFRNELESSPQRCMIILD